ncbi:hypothetical protein KCP73_00975 [Salmonella enterica subsp. enterica]|nr:hypothetical protein KCP73_00975 [Salmonella enterica subsp. enterica]
MYSFLASAVTINTGNADAWRYRRNGFNSSGHPLFGMFSQIIKPKAARTELVQRIDAVFRPLPVSSSF